ncbi:unnamed protein product [Effrenium voratum]|nr:unnamed protein product [Effrenium voratum]CAJ1447641.1 unnamed protein product [Effrenium voratum]
MAHFSSFHLCASGKGHFNQGCYILNIRARRLKVPQGSPAGADYLDSMKGAERKSKAFSAMLGNSSKVESFAYCTHTCSARRTAGLLCSLRWKSARVEGPCASFAQEDVSALSIASPPSDLTSATMKVRNYFGAFVAFSE